MSRNILDIKSNFMYEVIYSVQNKQHGLKFPIERVEQYLITEGYKKINIESTNLYSVMIKEGDRVFIGQKSICFEVLLEEFKERYNQKIISFIILRYKIFSDATIQNIESAQINLIQNKLRTCVSNMYYSLHNGISAMVEYYKSINDNTKILDVSNEVLDDEAFLGHFTPAALNIFLENINKICSSDKDEYLKNNDMKSGRMKSENNPFAWIYPLFYDKISEFEIENSELNVLLEDMATAIIDISLDNIAVDDTQKRSSFERELKKSLEFIKDIIRDEEKKSTKYILAVLSGYFSYAYMLRQLGDYDSLFEIKVNQKEIIRWTITSAQFVDIILKYLNISDNEKESKIQIINARSSKETLNDLYLVTEMNLMTITGIIIDRNFKLIQYVSRLLKKQGYNLFNQNNEVPNYDNNSTGIIICKNIIITPYKCFITISNTGIFRIDVVISEYNYMNIKKTINTSYLERFIHKEILEEDFQILLSSKGKIVVGAPIIYQNDKYNKLELLIKTHSIIQEKYYRDVVKITENIANELCGEKNLIIPIINLFRENDRRMYAMNFVLKLRKLKREKNFFNNNINIIFIILENNENIMDEENIISIIRKREEIENNINIEYIKISDENLKQMLYGDQSYIRNCFKSIIESYEINRIDVLEKELSEEDYDDIDNKNIDDLEEIAIEVI